MQPSVSIAGVNDEPSDTWNLDEGLDVLDELGVRLIELREAGFAGVITAEPHMTHGRQFHTSGREGFTRATRRMIELVLAAGFRIAPTA